MRKIFFLHILMLLPLMASADAIEIDGIYYNLNAEDKTAEIAENPNGYIGDYVIPEYVNYGGASYKVTSIGFAAFFSQKKLTSIVLPSGISSFSGNPFSNCEGLLSIKVDENNVVFDSRENCNAIIETATNKIISGCRNTIIPNNVTAIGDEAFRKCGLTTIVIPSSVISVEEDAFIYCSTLESISVEEGNSVYDSRNDCNAIIETATNTLLIGCSNSSIPEGIVTIGRGAFAYFRNLTTISIPNSVKTIKSFSFDNTGISSIFFPEGLETIEECAFQSCPLSIIKIPKNVKLIESGAFRKLDNTKSITVDRDNDNYDSRENCNAIIETKTNTLIAGCMNTIIPHSVTSIGYDAFGSCGSLASIVIPEGVTTIGNGAFSWCTALESISIPNSVTSIGERAFERCSSLISIVSEVKSPFAVHCFDDNIYSKTTLTIPKGTKAAYQATEGWKEFQNIVEENTSSETYTTEPKQTIHVAIAGSLSSYISDSDKYGIEELTLTGSLNGSDFRLLREMAGVNRLGQSTDGSLKILDISGAKIVSGGDRYIDIPGGVNFTIEKNNVIPEYVFHDCRLKEIKLPSDLIEIEDEAFENCILLEQVEFFDKLSIIGEEAFNACKRLRSLTIPSSVSSIAPRAFFDCSGLTSISSEIVSPPAISSDVFSSETYDNVRLIVPSGTLSKYKSTNGWNYFKTIVEYITSETVENNGIEYLCSFDEKTATITSVSNSLNDVRIPSSIMGKSGEYSVISISDFAFNGCNLNYLSLPETITSLTEETFSGCSICAMSWNANAELFKKAFRNTTMSTDYNFLLYVKSADYAPQTVKNVIVGNTAESITLSDRGDRFYCPIAFTAKKISYTHHFGMETGGNGKGWETIVLPFDVEKVTHSTKGEIVSFSNWNKSSTKRPFWLYMWGGMSFVKASSISANIPYLIAMPNQSDYDNSYILTGDVTFSSENVRVVQTTEFNGTFVPTYAPVPRSSSIYALNVINNYVSNSGGKDAGSCFISNLRDIRPFEAYIKQTNSTRGIFGINIDNTTDLNDLLKEDNSTCLVDVYSLSGQHIGKLSQGQISELPKGVYIVNGKKIVK